MLRSSTRLFWDCLVLSFNFVECSSSLLRHWSKHWNTCTELRESELKILRLSCDIEKFPETWRLRFPWFRTVKWWSSIAKSIRNLIPILLVALQTFEAIPKDMPDQFWWKWNSFNDFLDFLPGSYRLRILIRWRRSFVSEFYYMYVFVIGRCWRCNLSPAGGKLCSLLHRCPVPICDIGKWQRCTDLSIRRCSIIFRHKASPEYDSAFSKRK